MKKFIYSIFAATAIFALVFSIDGFSNTSSDGNPYNCGYGSTYLGFEYCPAGYVMCYRPDGKAFREVGVCSTITWGGCTVDECASPCYTLEPI